MHPCVTPNTTNTMSEGWRGGGRWRGDAGAQESRLSNPKVFVLFLLFYRAAESSLHSSLCICLVLFMWHSFLFLFTHDHDCFANTFIYLCWQEHDTSHYICMFFPWISFLSIRCWHIYGYLSGFFFVFFLKSKSSRSLFMNNKRYLSVPSETADIPVMTHTKCLWFRFFWGFRRLNNSVTAREWWMSCLEETKTGYLNHGNFVLWVFREKDSHRSHWLREVYLPE